MSEAPYSDMEPATDLVASGNPPITALAKRGSYYPFHFGQAKEAADRNIGFFGPATSGWNEPSPASQPVQ